MLASTYSPQINKTLGSVACCWPQPSSTLVWSKKKQWSFSMLPASSTLVWSKKKQNNLEIQWIRIQERLIQEIVWCVTHNAKTWKVQWSSKWVNHLVSLEGNCWSMATTNTMYSIHMLTHCTHELRSTDLLKGGENKHNRRKQMLRYHAHIFT